MDTINTAGAVFSPCQAVGDDLQGFDSRLPIGQLHPTLGDDPLLQLVGSIVSEDPRCYLKLLANSPAVARVRVFDDVNGIPSGLRLDFRLDDEEWPELGEEYESLRVIYVDASRLLENDMDEFIASGLQNKLGLTLEDLARIKRLGTAVSFSQGLCTWILAFLDHQRSFFTEVGGYDLYCCSRWPGISVTHGYLFGGVVFKGWVPTGDRWDECDFDDAEDDAPDESWVTQDPGVAAAN